MCYALSVFRWVMVSQSGFQSFKFNKYRSHFNLKLPTLFISLYAEPSSAANLAK